MIPSDFKVDLGTSEPIVVKLDVSERTMGIAAFVVVVAALAIKKIKG